MTEYLTCILVSAPLAGFLKVDVHDAAWTIFNIGILDLDFTVFKAELCFKGKVEYDLNILGVRICCVNYY